jgi:hypothetical protein
MHLHTSEMNLILLSDFLNLITYHIGVSRVIIHIILVLLISNSNCHSRLLTNIFLGFLYHIFTLQTFFSPKPFHLKKLYDSCMVQG